MTDKKPAKAKVKVPTGYDDVASFLEEARERFQEAIDFDRENRDHALEDLRFYAGEQWDDDAREQRKGLPCLTINQLPQFVAQVVGDIRINRPAIRVRPAEDADKDLAEIREGLIRAIERDNDAQGVYIQAGENQVACGIGNFRAGLKYASDDGFDRDIAIESIPNPVAVVWDPLSVERTGKDARFCFVVDEMPRKAFEAAYGDVRDTELEVPTHDRDGWYTRDVVRITDYWIIKQEPVKLALLEGGQVVDLKDVPPGVQPVQVRDSFRRSACMYRITGHEILAGPFDLPIDRVPIFRVRGWEVNVGDRRVRWGLVRFAKDAQRLKNYWRSVAAQAIALAPKGKWLASTRAVPEDREDDFRASAKGSDPLMLYDEGATVPQWINPPPPPTALLQEAAMNTQDMKDVTGLHDASLGARSNETSGKAIMARQREGDVATYVFHDNLQAAIKECGRVVNQLIPVVYDTARTIRVIGEDDSVKVRRINDPNDPSAQDINKGRYDIVVETGPSYSTKRVEAAESMMQFVQAVPPAAQVAGDLIAKAQDWPMAEEIGERLKRAMPPQLVESADDEQTPEQVQAKKMAMQKQQEAEEMQRQAAMLDLEAKAAGVEKLRADAFSVVAQAQAKGAQPQMDPLEIALKQEQVRKARAEADKAEIEAAKARATLPAEVTTANADAAKAEIAVESSAMDLERKPLEAMHSEADLNNKLRPPEQAAE